MIIRDHLVRFNSIDWTLLPEASSTSMTWATTQFISSLWMTWAWRISSRTSTLSTRPVERRKKTPNNNHCRRPSEGAEWLIILNIKTISCTRGWETFRARAIHRFHHIVQFNQELTNLRGLSKLIQTRGSKVKIQHPKTTRYSKSCHLMKWLSRTNFSVWKISKATPSRLCSSLKVRLYTKALANPMRTKALTS